MRGEARLAYQAGASFTPVVKPYGSHVLWGQFARTSRNPPAEEALNPGPRFTITIIHSSTSHSIRQLALACRRGHLCNLRPRCRACVPPKAGGHLSAHELTSARDTSSLSDRQPLPTAVLGKLCVVALGLPCLALACLAPFAHRPSSSSVAAVHTNEPERPLTPRAMPDAASYSSG